MAELSDQEFIKLLEQAVENLSWCLQEAVRRKMRLYIKYKEHQYEWDDYFNENSKLKLLWIRREFSEILYDKGIKEEAKEAKEYKGGLK